MRKTIRFLAVITMAIMIFTAPATAGTETPPVQTQLTIELEGMEELITVTEYRQEGSFRVWYDAAYFAPFAQEQGVKFELMDNQLSGEVSFSVVDIGEQAGSDGLAPDEYMAVYQREGWTTEALDAGEMFPLLIGAQAPAPAFLAGKDGQRALVYLAKGDGAAFLCTLLYPQEAGEGWGARMHYMLNTLEYLPAE